jgi:hypothetical protein
MTSHWFRFAWVLWLVLWLLLFDVAVGGGGDGFTLEDKARLITLTTSVLLAALPVEFGEDDSSGNDNEMKEVDDMFWLEPWIRKQPKHRCRDRKFPVWRKTSAMRCCPLNTAAWGRRSLYLPLGARQMRPLFASLLLIPKKIFPKRNRSVSLKTFVVFHLK